MTLSELLAGARQELGPDATADDLAVLVLMTVLRSRDVDAEELLLPVLLPWVRKQEQDRARVRAAEERAFGRPEGARNPGDVRLPNPAEEAMRNLLAEGCYVIGHGVVKWGEMTRPYHQIRIGFLQRTMDQYVTGTKATIRRHEFAAGLLAESGCADLNEYAGLYGSLPPDLTGIEAAETASA